MEFGWTRVASVGKGGLVEVCVPLLEEGTTVEVVIRDEPAARAKPRKFGSAKGQGRMTADFDEPLAGFHECA